MSALLAAVELGREGARTLVRQQLRDPAYDAARPPLLQRLVRALGRRILDALDALTAAAPGGGLGAAALLVLLVLFVAVVLSRVGPLARRTAGQELFAGGRRRTAAEHRELAEQAAAAGRFQDAVRERLRAVVRELEARGVLDERPGRTAGEIARDGGQALPAAAADLASGARIFDEVWYGGRTADAGSYTAMVEVDARVSQAPLVAP